MAEELPQDFSAFAGERALAIEPACAWLALGGWRGLAMRLDHAAVLGLHVEARLSSLPKLALCMVEPHGLLQKERDGRAMIR